MLCFVHTEDICTQGNVRWILKFKEENNTQHFPKVTKFHLPLPREGYFIGLFMSVILTLWSVSFVVIILDEHSKG